MFTLRKILFILSASLLFTLSGCGGGGSGDGDNSPVSFSPSTTGTEKFQVKNDRLEMYSRTSEAVNRTERLYFGRYEPIEPNPDFISIEGDLSLIDSKITNNARARIYIYLEAYSLSSNEYVNFFLALENRSNGLMSRAFMETPAGERPITALHNIPMTRGEKVKYKIELLNSSTDFARLSIGNHSAVIKISDLTASDLVFVQGLIGTHVREAEAGDFVKSSVDNVVIKMKKAGQIDTYTEDFNNYADGTAPIDNETVNSVSFPESKFTKRVLTRNPWYIVQANGDCYGKFVYNEDGTAKAYFIDNGNNEVENFAYGINSNGELIATRNNGEIIRYDYVSGNSMRFNLIERDSSNDSTDLIAFKFYESAIRYTAGRNNNCTNDLPR